MNEDNYHLYVLNEKNIEINEGFIEEVLSRYDITYKVSNINIALYKEAMVHTSYTIGAKKNLLGSKNKVTITHPPIKNPDDAIPLFKDSYERLEFVGDAVIHLILAEYFYKRYENEAEGFMTRLRTKVENGDTLACLSKLVGLNDYIIISKYMELNNAREENTSALEDVFEAFFGALYLDAGFNICRDFFVRLLEKHVNISKLLYTKTNFKDILLRFFHKRKWIDPKYCELDASGVDKSRIYTMCVIKKEKRSDEGVRVGVGKGSSKKKGEQMAAKEALIYYGELKDDNYSDDDTVEEYSSSEEYEDIE